MWNNVLFTSDKGLYKIKNGLVDCLVQNTVCYGLTWNDDNIFLCEPSRIIVFDKQFHNEAVWPETGVDLHQCAWADGKLYVCATKWNKVQVIDTTTDEREFKEFKHSDKHLNSVFVHGDHLYFCLHGNCKAKCIDSADLHSFVMKMTKDFEEVGKWTQLGCGNHNVYIEGNKLYTLSSTRSQIIEVNMDTNEKREVFIDPIGGKTMYPRGLARNDDYFYIGAAQHSEREHRKVIKSYILAYDNDLNLVDHYEIPDFHHIREVRLVNQVDKAHNDRVLTL